MNIKALLLSLLCLVSLPAVAEPVYGKYAKDINELEKTAWRLACVFKAVDCSNIPAPQVWYMAIESDYGRYYRGAPGIVINLKLAGETFSGMVMVHEMVHYIQGFQLPFNLMYMNRCVRESEAFNITAAAAYFIGYRDYRLNSWPDMSRQYGCLGNEHFKRYY